MRGFVHTLLVEDEPNMVRTLAKILERRGFRVDSAANGAEALPLLEQSTYDLLITDLNMPVMDGMQLLREMQTRGISLPTIVLTGHGSIQSAVEAMQLGAGDYLIKPCDPDELLLVAERLLELRDLRREVKHLRAAVRRSNDHFGPMVGKSAAMRDVYRTVDAVSQNKSNVIILGDNGTGKELVARTLHQRGAWADKPFVAVNCGALSETLLESQLFGHRRGAFTGAIEDHDGVFLAASGGTLFLDEITDIPAALQVKFLRAIQEKEVMPLGSSRSLRFDARLVAATNRDIEAMVLAGRFRSDLYYRLNVVTITLPPLRERRDDLEVLIEHFVEQFSQSYGVQPRQVTPEAMRALQAYSWPGNVRELQNVIERAFALSVSSEISLDDLPLSVRAPIDTATAAVLGDSLSLGDLERRTIAAALQRSGGNKNEAARLLGIERQRLYRKMEKYGLT